MLVAVLWFCVSADILIRSGEDGEPLHTGAVCGIGEEFGEWVGGIVLRCYVKHVDCPVIHKFSGEEVSNVDVLSSIIVDLVRSNGDGALVVNVDRYW